MRGADITQEELFSYRTLDARIPKHHLLRKLRAVVDMLLTPLNAEFDALYARSGRDSIPPERLLRASLLQSLVFATLRAAAGGAYRFQFAVPLAGL